MSELQEVLERPHFHRYKSVAERKTVPGPASLNLKPVEVLAVVALCRDPKDNKFMALANDGNADVIITGDADLLVPGISVRR